VITDGWLDQLIARGSARIDIAAGPNRCDAEKAVSPERRTGERNGQVEKGNGSGGPGVGLVGPMSNFGPLPQLVPGLPDRDLDEMHRFARRWRDEHRGQWFTAGKRSGFCVLMKRAVYEAVGGLDERFGLGYFDDEDLAIRARRAGFELAVAHDLFVYH